MIGAHLRPRFAGAASLVSVGVLSRFRHAEPLARSRPPWLASMPNVPKQAETVNRSAGGRMMIRDTTWATITAATFVGGMVMAGAASAQDLTVDRIREALSPTASMTRSLSAHRPEIDADSADFVDSLRNRPVASFTGDDRTKLAAFKADKPSIDLELQFDFNSDALRGPALRTATLLGDAITSPEFKGRTFLIAGYTDAKGSEPFNQALSERRAEAVRTFLIRRYRLAPTDLIAVGYGKTDLKDPANPTGAINRRVQAVNLLPTRSAAR